MDPAFLRERVVSGVEEVTELPADLVIGLGAWRAGWSVISQLPALNQRSRGPAGRAPSATMRPSLRSLAAGMQRDYGSLLVAKELASPDQITMPLNPRRWGQMLDQIEGVGGDLFGADDPVPSGTASATERAAVAWAMLVLEEPFAVGNRVMGPLLAKYILAERGVEPTAVSVITVLATEKAGEYRSALNSAAAGDWEPWVAFFRRSVIRGCEVGQHIALQVQAGKLA